MYHHLHLPKGWRHLALNETDSLMNLPIPEAGGAETAETLLVTAEFQTSGRGQRGTLWESNRSDNLLFSIVVRPDFLTADRQFLLSEAISLAIAETLAELVGNITIKWPNDIYVGDRKICGMLLEHRLCGRKISHSLIGVGLNVNQSLFRSDAPNPVSLRQLLGRQTSRENLLGKIVDRFNQLLGLLQRGETDLLHYAYCHRLYRRTERHFYSDGKEIFAARIIDVEPQGRLLLRDDNGLVRSYAFKEVRFVLPTGPTTLPIRLKNG